MNRPFKKVLLPYPEPITPEAIFSADLSLRYMSTVLTLAAGLAPNDPLILHLQKHVSAWPFSAVEMNVPETPETDAALEIILDHPSLQLAYADRIITSKKLSLIRNVRISESVREALGDYPKALWPEFLELQLEP